MQGLRNYTYKILGLRVLTGLISYSVVVAILCLRKTQEYGAGISVAGQLLLVKRAFPLFFFLPIAH